MQAVLRSRCRTTSVLWSLLVVTLVILATFRIGQKFSGAKGVATATAKTPVRTPPQNAADRNNGRNDDAGQQRGRACVRRQ